MNEIWRARFETAPSTLEEPLAEAPLDDVTANLEAFGATGVTGGWEADGTALGVSFCIEAPTLAEAFNQAHRAMRKALESAQLRGELVASDITPFERPRYSQAVPADSLEAIGASDAARILGVSRQRVYQLMQAHEGFPEPVARLARGALWSRSAIEAWAEGWDRAPGRPRAS